MNYIHLRRGSNGQLGSYRSFDLFDRSGRYVRNDALERGGATVVYAHDPVSGAIKLQVARCRFNESYSRKKGRAAATSSPTASVYWVMLQPGKMTGRQLFDIVYAWTACL